MTEKTFTNDMTLMYAFHDALRRNLETLARITESGTDDPRHILHTALGWELFKRYLHVHHEAEDDVLWPPIREAVADRPNELAVILAMEAEHAAVDPGLDAIDAALADRESGPERLAGIFEGLVAGLGGHLRHEEDEALPLIDVYATPEVFQRFGAEHGIRIGDGASIYVPWLVDGAPAEVTAAVLARLPEPVRAAYQAEWEPRYAELDLWVAR